MNSILLKTTDSGEELVIYGFERWIDAQDQWLYFNVNFTNKELVFLGSKEELLSKDIQWISQIIEETESRFSRWKGYVDYLNPETQMFVIGNKNAEINSLDSALSCLTHNKYILIIKRTT